MEHIYTIIINNSLINILEIILIIAIISQVIRYILDKNLQTKEKSSNEITKNNFNAIESVLNIISILVCLGIIINAYLVWGKSIGAYVVNLIFIY